MLFVHLIFSSGIETPFSAKGLAAAYSLTLSSLLNENEMLESAILELNHVWMELLLTSIIRQLHHDQQSFDLKRNCQRSFIRHELST
jgi:hypothetical protein